MAMARIKLLRNKRQVVVKQMRAETLPCFSSLVRMPLPRIRVEHVIREQNVMAANEFIELFCELVVARISIIAKRRECPADLKEGIASLIFAAPRCSDIPELLAIRDIFEKKYGKDFASAATDLRPSCGVNRMLIDKLSVRTPTGEVKMKVMKEIAKEYQINWDTTESEMELLKPPEELIEGPKTFVSATSIPVKPKAMQPVEPNNPITRSTGGGESDTLHFENSASAAEAAAESAKKAIAAAQAAAYLANKDPSHFTQAHGFDSNLNASSINRGFGGNLSGNSTGHFMPNDPQNNSRNIGHQSEAPGRIYESQSFDRSYYLNNDMARPTDMDTRKAYRRHSYNAPTAHSDMKFDESDCDEEIEMEEPPPGGMYLPPDQPPPAVPASHVKKDPVPRVHPKLPDYDTLAARFEALKYRKSQPKN
ncbi:hypothetical protein L1049_024921 [Liquidambar formosana]|uniref:IST1-like protein n=1 Tax=Liquidambar formosana TaxID=63359 RepID=A0AAP0S1S4_LIQFO